MQTTSKKAEIIFVPVQSVSAKLNAICSIVGDHFRRGKHLLITVPAQEAAQYIDQLLWKIPEDSFIPHAMTDQESQHPIVITTKQHNINHAEVLLNLCPNASPIFDQFEKVYELFDETDPTKAALSKNRMAYYQN